MTYVPGETRDGLWSYAGQREPDDHAQPEEQRWYDGHVTTMRLGIMLEGVDGEGQPLFEDDDGYPIWLRQWHSHPAEPDAEQPDQCPVREGRHLHYRDGVYVAKIITTIEPPHILDFKPLVPIWEMITNWPGTTFLVDSDVAEGRFTERRIEVDTTTGRAVEETWSRDIAASELEFPVVGHAHTRIELSYDEALNWKLVSTGDDVPVTRDQQLSLDVIMGGYKADGSASTTAWIGRSWIDGGFLASAGSTTVPMQGAQFFFDRENGRLFVFADSTGGTSVRSLDLTGRTFTWEETWESAPNGLVLPADTVVIPTRDRAYLLSSDSRTMKVGELTFSGDGPELTDPTTSGALPPALTGFSATYLPSSGSVALFGGEVSSGDLTNAVWLLETATSTWTAVAAMGTAPTPRRDAVLVADSGSLFVLGGVDQVGAISDSNTWALDLSERQSVWSRSSVDAQNGLIAGMSTAPMEEVVRTGERAEFDLLDFVRGANGETLMQVTVSDPSESLALSTEARVSSDSGRLSAAGTSHTITAWAAPGEERKVVVEQLPGVEEDASSYAVEVAYATKGDRLKKLSFSPLTRFDVEGDLVAVAAWTRLDVFRRDGDSVSKIGTVSMPSAVDVVLDGGFAYVVDFYHGLKVVDLSDPASPEIVGTEWVLGFADSITKVGDRLFVGTGLLGVQVVDVTDPSSPAWVDTYCMGDVVVDVSSAGNLLAVSTLWDGVSLITARPDGDLVPLAVYDTCGWVEDVSVRATEMYVTHQSGMIEVVDVRLPSKPEFERLSTRSLLWHTGRMGDDMVVIPRTLWGIDVYDVAPLE